MLSSYEIPAGENKNTFSYDSMSVVEYSKLKMGRGEYKPFYPEYDIQIMGEVFRHLSGGIGKYGSEWKQNLRV